VSRDEFKDDGVLTVRRVLRRFERVGPVLDVTVNGRVIGTTHEHPFFVRGRGWTKAQELRVGDDVRLMGPGWATVEAVSDTGRLETVYNLEIEDDHTYFVGCDEWGISVWAHNSYGEFERIVTNPNLKVKLSTFDAQWAYRRTAQQGEAALRAELKAAGLHPKTIDKGVAVAKADGLFGKPATFGHATSFDYAETFLQTNPSLKGKVVVHHAVEQQTLTRFTGVVTEAEIHSLQNLRGIPNAVNSKLNLSDIRVDWNRFYKANPNPTKQQLLDKATEIDRKFGSQFNPPV